MPIITLDKRNVYGNDLLYPINYANELQALTGRKTLTNKHIEALKGLGFKVEQCCFKLKLER